MSLLSKLFDHLVYRRCISCLKSGDRAASIRLLEKSIESAFIEQSHRAPKARWTPCIPPHAWKRFAFDTSHLLIVHCCCSIGHCAVFLVLSRPQPAVAIEPGTSGIVSFSRVLVPLMVTGTYGVLVSLTLVKAHLGMTQCTPQLPAASVGADLLNKI